MREPIRPYYCYTLQVWLADERVLRCGHLDAYSGRIERPFRAKPNTRTGQGEHPGA